MLWSPTSLVATVHSVGHRYQGIWAFCLWKIRDIYNQFTVGTLHCQLITFWSFTMTLKQNNYWRSTTPWTRESDYLLREHRSQLEDNTSWTRDSARTFTRWTRESARTFTLWTRESARTFTRWTRESARTFTRWTRESARTFTRWTRESARTFTQWIRESARTFTPWTRESARTFTQFSKYQLPIDWYNILKPISYFPIYYKWKRPKIYRVTLRNHRDFVLIHMLILW